MKEKSRLCEAVDFKDFDECTIEVDKVLLLWNSKCYIMKSGLVSTVFALCEYDTDDAGMNRRLCRFTISESDALQIIRRMKLNYYPECAAEGYYAQCNPGTVYF